MDKIDRRQDVIFQKYCECGCGDIISVRRWHLNATKSIPKMKRGHGQVGNMYGWKGGKIKCNGYWLVYSPDHPSANAMGKGYVRQNRIIMEAYLGRYLDDFEIVHHCNHQPDDDRIENLDIMTNSAHLSLHHKNRPKTRNRLGQFTKGG